MSSILCTICMRSGSKGVKNKNLKNLNGKPLMGYTIEQAKKSKLFKHIVISTDSDEIAQMARTFGAESWFIRPDEMATDNAPKIPVIRHALLEAEMHYGLKFDTIIDLDATSPLRTMKDINKAYKQFVDQDSDILITACPSRKNPYFNMVEEVDGRIKKIKELKSSPIRRQDAPKVYDMNASIYIWKRSYLLNGGDLFTQKTSLYIMPEIRSIDIDSELDWAFVEYILSNKMRKK